MSLAKLFFKSLEIELSKEIVYKWNFIIKLISIMTIDVVSPLITLLIYSTTSGIPGWSFEQFLLFQGIFIFVMGISHATQFAIGWTTVYNVREGTFDKFLTKPYNPLVYLTLTSFDLEGFGEVFVGLFLIIFGFVKLDLAVLSWNFLAFAVLILAAILFMYSLIVLISALAFIFVKSFGLFNIFFNILEMARYPSTIYGSSIRFMITFLFPVAIASTFPALAILEGFSLFGVVKAILPVIGFFLLSLFLWSAAMKKHSSAGG